MIRHTQSDFKTIAEYGESIKQGEVKYAEIGNAVASWLQSSFFWLSLNSNLEPYTFQIVNTNQAQKRELEIDEMMIALVDHDKRIQFSEETKSLATKMFHKKNSKKRKLQEIPTLSSSAPPAKKHHGKSSCDHCGSIRHDKKSRYFLLPAYERPPGYKPFARKDHLLKENMAGQRIAKSVKSMKVALTVNSKSTKNAGFYLDSAADDHMTYNRLLFST